VKQDYDNFEVLIIDSNSNTNTISMLKNYEKAYHNLHLIQVGECSIGAARSIGARKANGEIIAYVDSDVELPHNRWLYNMVQPFTDKTIAGVQTLAKAKLDDPEILKKVHSKFEYSRNVIDIDHYEPVGTSHLLIRKDLIELVGGFKDISFKEDTDLTYRIMQNGYKFVYLPDEKCYHYHVKNYGELVRKELRNKYRGFICLLKGIK
jgi:glycosyltransferase involved in cell wall biosynthesis